MLMESGMTDEDEWLQVRQFRKQLHTTLNHHQEAFLYGERTELFIYVTSILE